jgi:ketosteroid isomerase-like protein
MTTFGEARENVDAFAAALNAKDAEALGELFSDDAEFRQHPWHANAWA